MICRSLGFRKASKFFGDPGHSSGSTLNQVALHGFGEGTGRFMIGLECPAGASTLSQCSWTTARSDSTYCFHEEDAAVICIL